MSDNKNRFYNVLVQTYTAAQEVEVNIDCNGFTARNIGDTIVRINGIVLFPSTVPTSAGESLSIGGNKDEIYTGRIQVGFFGAGVNPLVEIVQKFYVGART